MVSFVSFELIFSLSGRLPQRCDVNNCLCPKGREYHMAGTDFEIIRCTFCGYKGTHMKCGNLDKGKPDHICDEHGDDDEEEEEDLPEPKKLRRDSSNSSSCESSSRCSSPASVSTDTSIDDDLVEAKLREGTTSSQVDEESNTSTDNSGKDLVDRCKTENEDSDDDIKFLEEVASDNDNAKKNFLNLKNVPKDLAQEFKHRQAFVESREKDNNEYEATKKTSSIADLLAKTASTSSSSPAFNTDYCKVLSKTIVNPTSRSQGDNLGNNPGPSNYGRPLDTSSCPSSSSSSSSSRIKFVQFGSEHLNAQPIYGQMLQEALTKPIITVNRNLLTKFPDEHQTNPVQSQPSTTSSKVQEQPKSFSTVPPPSSQPVNQIQIIDLSSDDEEDVGNNFIQID